MTIEIVDPDLAPPGTRFRPNCWAQERFLLSEAPELLYSGHWGSSKTRTLCEKADWICRSFPGAHVVLARKKREHMGHTTLPVLLDEVISPAHKTWGWRPAQDGGSTLFYPTDPPSQILCAGLDNPGRLFSGNFAAAFADEAQELDEPEWDGIGSRLRQRVVPFRQQGAACNPAGTGHFLYRRFQPRRGSHVITADNDTKLPNNRVIPAGTPIREIIMASALDNIENLPDDYLYRLSRLGGKWRNRYVLGLWEDFEGTVYDCWNEDIHLQDAPADWAEWGGYPPPDWRRYRSVDFGYVNPFVCQWWAVEPGGRRRRFRYREIYRTRTIVQDHAQRMRALEAAELEALNQGIDRWNKTHGGLRREHLTRIPAAMTIADHDAEDSATLARGGFATVPARKDVSAGIQATYQALMPQLDPLTGELWSSIVFVRGALVDPDPALIGEGFPSCTEEEIPGYSYPEAPPAGSGKPTKEDPKKVADHGCDGFRYFVYTTSVFGTVRAVRLHEPPRVEDD